MVTQIVNDQHLKTTTIITLILLETFINSLLLFFRLFLKLNPFWSICGSFRHSWTKTPFFSFFFPLQCDDPLFLQQVACSQKVCTEWVGTKLWVSYTGEGHRRENPVCNNRRALTAKLVWRHCMVERMVVSMAAWKVRRRCYCCYTEVVG